MKGIIIERISEILVWKARKLLVTTAGDHKERVKRVGVRIADN